MFYLLRKTNLTNRASVPWLFPTVVLVKEMPIMHPTLYAFLKSVFLEFVRIRVSGISTILASVVRCYRVNA